MLCKMTQHHRQIIHTPLIDPTASFLVLIPPNAGDIAAIKPRARKVFNNNLTTIVSAAQIMNVPVLSISSISGEDQKRKAVPPLLPVAPDCHFLSAEHSSLWGDPAFAQALAQFDRSILVLSGFWLEHQVLATALHALAESYDVYVVIDASPAYAAIAVQPSRERLLQAGATPVVTSQVIHEWSLEATNAATRSKLVSLLVPSAKRAH